MEGIIIVVIVVIVVVVLVVVAVVARRYWRVVVLCGLDNMRLAAIVIGRCRLHLLHNFEEGAVVVIGRTAA